MNVIIYSRHHPPIAMVFLHAELRCDSAFAMKNLAFFFAPNGKKFSVPEGLYDFLDTALGSSFHVEQH